MRNTNLTRKQKPDSNKNLALHADDKRNMLDKTHTHIIALTSMRINEQ